MKVSVFTTMPPGIYSGGRYLSLILAYSMSRAGADVTYVANNAPLFERDFQLYDSLCPIRSIISPDFSLPDDLTSDWVVVVPTGGFNGRFYNAAINHARAHNARLALLSFETPNWFASLSPWPRAAMPTEAWRQVVAGGGLVITIAEEGIAPAREYFGIGDNRRPRLFGHWHPAINDLAAEAAMEIDLPRRSITMFVRTEDPHKGAQDLLRIPPEVFEGNVLSLVFGRGVDHGFVTALRRHLSPARDVAVEVLSQISDLEKFSLLSRSKLLLFPSYFEGYGYPPVEAAWMGVPTVAYDLPLLQEVAGEAITRVRAGDIDAFAAAIQQTLATRPPGPDVRGKMRHLTDTMTSGKKMLDLLHTAQALLPPAQGPVPAIAVAGGGTGLSPQATQLASKHKGSINLYEASALLEAGNITFKAKIEGVGPSDTLQFMTPGGVIPSVQLNAAAPDMLHKVVSEGLLESWPVGIGRLNIRLMVNHGDGETTDLGSADLSPDWIALLSATPDGSQRHPGDAVVVADPNDVIARPMLAAALCELCGTLQKLGHRVTLLMPQDTAPPPDELVHDMLPIFDAVEIASAAPDALVNMARKTAAGGLVIAAGIFCNAAPEAFMLDPGGVLEERLALFFPECALAGRKCSFVPDASLWGRVGRATANAPFAVVLPNEPVSILDDKIRLHLKHLKKDLPGLRLLIPAPLFAAERDSVNAWSAVATPIGLSEIGQLLVSGSKVVGLRLGDNSKRSQDALRVEMMLATYKVPIADLDSHQTTAAARSLLLRESLQALGGFGKTLKAKLPPRTSRHEPVLTSFAEQASVHSPIVDPTSGVALPVLSPGNILGFSATIGNDQTGLANGWADRTVLGARIARDSGVISFLIDPLTKACDELEFMLHVSPAMDPELLVKVVLNGHLLATLSNLRAGSSHHRLSVPKSAWRDGEQTLCTILDRRNANPETKVTLIGLTVSRTPSPSLSPSEATSSVAGAREVPLYAPSIDDTSGIVRCSFTQSSGPGFLRLLAGWSYAEPDHTWSEGAQAVIGFRPSLVSRSPLLLCLRGNTFPVPKDPGRSGQRMMVRHGAHFLTEIWLDAAGPPVIAVPLPPPPTDAGIDALLLDFPDAVAPSDLGMGEETRCLGVALQEAECRTLSVCVGRATMQARADAEPRVLMAEVCAAAGVLRLIGEGLVPEKLRFGLADGIQAAWPVAMAGGGWVASLPVSADDLASGEVSILCLAADGGLPASPVECEAWAEPLARRNSAANEAVNVQVTVIAIHDRAPDAMAILDGGELPEMPYPPEKLLDLPTTFEFVEGSPDLVLLGHGWSTPEPEWVWSEGPDAVIHLPSPLGPALLRIDTGAFIFDGVDHQRAVLSCGSSGIATLRLTAFDETTLLVALPTNTAYADSLMLSLPDCTSPAAVGLAEDGRPLALRLHRIEVQTLPETILAAGRDERERSDASSLKILETAALPDGGRFLLLSGPTDEMPFGLAVAPQEGLASVISHALLAPGGWQALLAMTPEEIASDGQVQIQIYATAQEAMEGTPSACLDLPLPMSVDGFE